MSLDDQNPERFATLVNSTHCPYAREAKVHFAPSWDSRKTVEENVTVLLPALERFALYESKKDGDMFVVGVSDIKYTRSIYTLAKLLNHALHAIYASDLTSKGELTDGITTMEWDFTFKKNRFFIPVFAPFYDKTHARYSFHSHTAFIVFQPDDCFSRHNITSDNPSRREITLHVKSLFEKGGVNYDLSLVADSPKALRYLKPYNVGGKPIKWWEETY